MPDIDGNPDTDEIFEHWNSQAVVASGLMHTVRELTDYGRDFRPDAKEARVAEFRAAHPDCIICLTFNGNPPAPTAER